MPNNTAIIGAIDEAKLVNATVGGEIVKEIDLGEIADALKGQTLQVCVNPPAFIAPLLWRDYENIPRDKMLLALSMMTGIPVDAWARWSDSFVSIVFAKARAMFLEYDVEMRKNYKAD